MSYILFFSFQGETRILLTRKGRDLRKKLENIDYSDFFGNS